METPTDDLQNDADPTLNENPPNEASRSSWLRRNWVLASLLGGFVAMLIIAIIVGVACYLNGRHKGPSPEGYLADYVLIPSHEVYRPEPDAVLNNTDLQQCADNCTMEEQDFECLHVQFCAPEGTKLGICHLFGESTRLRARPAENCNIYTLGDPVDFGLPHGGAWSLKTGGVRGLRWILLAGALLSNFVA